MRKRIIAVTAATLLMTGCSTVEPGERGIKVELGAVKKEILEPGLFNYNPFTEGIHTFSIQQTTVDGKAEPLTADQQPISIEYKVLYKLPEAQLLNLFQNYHGEVYASLVNPQVQEAFRQIVSQYKADAVTKNVNGIKNQVLALVKDNLHALVDVVDIPVTHIGLPSVLQDAIAQKQVMEQQALQKQYELDKAKKEAEITVANAQAQAESIKLQTQALEKSPALIELKKAEKWNGVLPTTVVSGSNGANLFQLK